MWIWKEFISLFVLINFVGNGLVSSLCHGKYLTYPRPQLREIYSMNVNQYSQRPTEAIWENDGQTVVIKLKFKKSLPNLEYGSFGKEQYRLNFIYYNWLKESEDEGHLKERSVTFPAELHIVFVNKRFKSYEEALTKDLGVAVATFKHKIVDKFGQYDIVPMRYIYDPIKNISSPNTKAVYLSPQTPYIYQFGTFSLIYHLYRGKSIFGTGSQCSADVIWLDFAYELEITRNEIYFFRQLMSSNDVPLMSKIKEFPPPNGTIYKTISPYVYQVKNWTAKHFEGFDFAFDSGTILTKSNMAFLYIVLVIINVCIEN